MFFIIFAFCIFIVYMKFRRSGANEIFSYKRGVEVQVYVLAPLIMVWWIVAFFVWSVSVSESLFLLLGIIFIFSFILFGSRFFYSLMLLWTISTQRVDIENTNSKAMKWIFDSKKLQLFYARFSGRKKREIIERFYDNFCEAMKVEADK